MASSSRTSTALPSASATPVPSSPPPPSESFLSDIDGTAASVLDTSGDFQWDAGSSGHGLNLVSWKKGVDDGDETADKRGFYAISTVLNHPTKKANPLRSTRKPLPPLPPAPALPRPPPATHFDDYLRTVTPLYDTLVQSQANSSAAPDVLTGAFDTTRQPPSDLPSLDTIPDVFFSKEFDLANPSIWSEVVEAGPSRPRASATIQDDLSSHLDTLERHLIHEITLRSTSFFSALSNLQDLHSESASCLRRIADLQSGLRDVGENQARKGLTILDKMEDLAVLRVTEAGMAEMQQIEELLTVAKGLVEGGDWAGGLSCANDVVRWWERHRLRQEDEPPDPPDDGELEPEHPQLPLSTLPAFAALPLAISDLVTQIALQLEAALHSYLLSTLSSAELDDAYDEERLRHHVSPIVEGLVRCGAGDAVEGVWREVVTLAVREGSRKHLPVAQTEDEAEEGGSAQEMRGATLASALRSMDHSRYLLLTAQMYRSILARLRLAQTIGPDLASILSQSSSLAPIRIAPHLSPTAEVFDDKTAVSLPFDHSEIIASACELGNLRASKILAVRGEQHAGLGINEFVELFKENWEFVLATESLAGRMIASLRGMTASQARTFLIAYHSQRLTKSAKLVEEEQWNQIDCPAAIQHNVDILIESAVSDPAECFIPSRPAVANGHKPNESGTGSSKMLDIEDAKFFLVLATGETISLLKDYLNVVVNLELVVTDVMGRIIEFLKSFNSRTCQVVLGAGAMRSAGLKNITAKHLALASQSLSIIVALIPYIREFIRRHLSPKQAVMLIEFDKLKRDYQEHQNEIHAKLVAIMSDRLAVHVGSLRDVDWEATPDKDGARGYAELLVKETATLHKVLSKYLAPSTVETVMSEVLAAITHRLSEEYGKIELKSDEAKKRMVQDASLIVARLSPLSEAGKNVSSLETLVMDKPVPRKNLIGNLLKRGKKEDGLPVAAADDPSVGGGEEYDDGDDEGPADSGTQEVAGDAAPGTVRLSQEIAAEQSDTATEVQTVPAGNVSRGSSDTPRDSTESTASAASTAATSVPETSEASAPTTKIARQRAEDPAAPDTPAKPVVAPDVMALPAVLPEATTASPSAPTPPIKSPPPPVKSPPPILSPSSIRSPAPASPSPGPAPTAPIRTPRVSLANRLKGVLNRAGSVDRDAEPVRSPSPVQAVPLRRSIEGARRSLEGERPAISAILSPVEAEKPAPTENTSEMQAEIAAPPNPAKVEALEELEPTAEPTAEPTSEPAADRSAKTTAERAADPTGDPMAEPTVEATTEPTAEAREVVAPEIISPRPRRTSEAASLLIDSAAGESDAGEPKGDIHTDEGHQVDQEDGEASKDPSDPSSKDVLPSGDQHLAQGVNDTQAT